MRICAWGMAFGLTMVLIGHVQGLRPPAIETHELFLADLSAHLNGTTVAVMAGLHVGEVLIGADCLNARIDQVQDLKPDAIVLTGDLFERASNPAEMVPVMRRLSAPRGVWAVRGNHDALHPDRRDVTGEILDTISVA
jgi:hypothetical protein